MLELIRVQDDGPHLTVTIRFKKNLAGYFLVILDQLSGIARQIQWKAKCATAERRAILHALPNDSDPSEVNKVRNEMILFLSEEKGWSPEEIGKVYNLSPGNIRQIKARTKKKPS